jgi:hypothetical protein
MSLSLGELESVLNSYLQVCWPAMLRQRYHLLLAKGGQDFPHLPEQPLLTHILNGVFGLIRLLRFLVDHQVRLPELDVTFLRHALALYTLHDLGKLPNVEHLDDTEFSIPLERLQQEYEILGLAEFAEVDTHLMRAANVHKRSSRQGDLLQSPDPHPGLLYTFVRSADAMASATSPEEVALSLSGWLERLGPEFSPGQRGRFALYWHQLDDVRGVLTNVVHQSVAKRLEAGYGFYPLLYFATGLLYIGPRINANLYIDRPAFIESVVTDALQALVSAGDAREMAREGLRPPKFDFQSYVYAFADVSVLLELIRDDSLIAKANTSDLVREDRSTKQRLLGKDFSGLLSREKLPPGWTSETVFPKLELALDEPPAFLEHWARSYRYLLYTDSLVRDLVPDKAQPKGRLDEWFLEQFPIPEIAAKNLRQIGELWAKGGPGKYVIPIAYHFLRGPAFRDQPTESLPAAEVLNRLHDHTLAAFNSADTRTSREAKVTKLGFRPDLTAYLNEHLRLSWLQDVKAGDDALPAYMRPKRKSHGDRFCSLCNRSSLYVQPLRTGILDDEGRIFSNRVLPQGKAPGDPRPWCPICHLEFVFRKLVGLGLPPGADYGNSRRLYLYILPTFSFTPEHLNLFSTWLHRFQQVTNIPVWDYGLEWGLPHRWLQRGELDPDWLEEVQAVLGKQAERIASSGGHAYVGERLVTGQVQGQPHYYLIVWEKLARGQEQDDARIATRTEAWAKGTLVAMVIAALSGCKVYITERPYLPMTDTADLKGTITFDSPPPALRLVSSDGITLYGRERGTRSGLEQALNLATALWAVNEHLQRHLDTRNQKDKRISERLALANISSLAGATFYKEYSRLNDGRSPDEALTRACQVLINLRGGELMDLVQRLAEKSLEIALPSGRSGRGKPRRYELLFRDTVAAMRQAFDAIPELRKTALTNQSPSQTSISELKTLTAGTLLKALERRQQQRRGEIIVRSWGESLSRRAGEFVSLVVDELYLGWAGGSFARLLRLDDTVADGLFYYIDQALDQKWAEYNQQKAAQHAAQS